MTHCRSHNRSGLTLTELLVAMTVTTLIVAAVSAFSHAALQGWEAATQSGNTTQAGRVILSRIAQKVATSKKVLILTNSSGTGSPVTISTFDLTSTWATSTPTYNTLMRPDQFLLVWERDGGPDDPTPGQANFVELVIYAPHREHPEQLLELRPQVDPALVVPLNEPYAVYLWMDRFCRGQDVVQPPTVLLSQLGGVHFEVEEFQEPEGLAGVVQQDVRIGLCVSPPNQPAAAFFGSATRRYLPSSTGTTSTLLAM